MKSDGLSCLWKWNSSCLSVCSSELFLAMLHITFNWFPLSIGEKPSQVWCRPYLAAHFGFFVLVQVSTFYPFTLKVGSKCTYTCSVLTLYLQCTCTSPNVKPRTFFLFFLFIYFFDNFIFIIYKKKQQLPALVTVLILKQLTLKLALKLTLQNFTLQSNYNYLLTKLCTTCNIFSFF